MKKKTKKRLQQVNWIISYTKKEGEVINVLNKKFVEDFINEFSVKHDLMFFGASKCKELSKTLAFGFKIGLLSRKPVSLTAWSSGFPKWVYDYTPN
jgi:hypothetical protein